MWRMKISNLLRKSKFSEMKYFYLSSDSLEVQSASKSVNMHIFQKQKFSKY